MMFNLLTAEKRKLELAEKFKKLQESGQLEKYLAKKKKKNMKKEKKLLLNDSLQ